MANEEKVNIVVVDDQPAKLVALDSILAPLGENLIKVESGLKALEFLLKNQCAVIVLDVNMPGMDGFETATLIRQRPSLERTPIIFVSAYNVSDLDRLKGYGIGAVDYLYVPIVPEVLRAKVQAFVDLFRQRQIIIRQAEHLAAQNREKEEQIRVIQRLNEKLREANEEIEAFSYSVSHDLRAPLRAMRGYSEILLTEFSGAVAGEGADYLLRISKAAKQMDALIRDILAYSCVAKAELFLQPLDVSGILRTIMETSEALQPPRAKVTIEDPIVNVVGHEACLNQCLSNLLSNAVKFVTGDRVPEVRIMTQARGSRVRICVKDNGIGIAPAHLDRVFQMFGRVHSGSAYDGNGIGLTIVRKGVERMGGSVGVESEPGVGSMFWIELPAAGKEAVLMDLQPGLEPAVKD